MTARMVPSLNVIPSYLRCIGFNPCLRTCRTIAGKLQSWSMLLPTIHHQRREQRVLGRLGSMFKEQEEFRG